MPYKRGKKWVAQVRINGIRREKIFLSKKDAVAWEVAMKQNPETVLSQQTNTASLFDWSQAYLSSAEARFAKSTYEEKRSMFRMLFKEVDPTLPVSDLTPARVQAYVTKQKELRSGYAANKDRKNLVAAWNWGMKYMDPQLPGPNPCKVEKMPEVRTPRYVPPEEDFWKVLNQAEGQDQVMLLAFLHLAARRKEVFRLKWEDIDFDNRRIRLWTKKRMGGNLECDWLPLTEELKEALLWWRGTMPVKGQPYVFLCLDKKPFCRDSYGKPFQYRIHFMKSLCELAGVKPFGFHAIRHLSASTLYREGYDVAVMQKILRHKNPNTTVHYLRTLGIEDVRDALESLSSRLGNGVVLPFRPRLPAIGRKEVAKKKPSREPSTPETAVLVSEACL